MAAVAPWGPCRRGTVERAKRRGIRRRAGRARATERSPGSTEDARLGGHGQGLDPTFVKQFVDLGLDQVDGDLVVATLGEDDVGVALGGIDEFQVHRPHALEVLVHHAVHRSAALDDVATRAADEAHLRIGIDEPFDVHDHAQLGVDEDGNALEHDHEMVADQAVLSQPAVLAVDVYRLFELVAVEELPGVKFQQLAVERVRMVEIAELAVAVGNVVQILARRSPGR